MASRRTRAAARAADAKCKKWKKQRQYIREKFWTKNSWNQWISARTGWAGTLESPLGELMKSSAEKEVLRQIPHCAYPPISEILHRSGLDCRWIMILISQRTPFPRESIRKSASLRGHKNHGEQPLTPNADSRRSKVVTLSCNPVPINERFQDFWGWELLISKPLVISDLITVDDSG